MEILSKKKQVIHPEERGPGWQVRCRKCGFTVTWGKFGIRLGAQGTSYTIAWCPQCCWFRVHVIEKLDKTMDNN